MNLLLMAWCVFFNQYAVLLFHTPAIYVSGLKNFTKKRGFKLPNGHFYAFEIATGAQTYMYVALYI